MPIHMSYLEKCIKGMSVTLILSLVVLFFQFNLCKQIHTGSIGKSKFRNNFISGRRVMRIRHSGDYSSIDERTEKFISDCRICLHILRRVPLIFM